MNIKRFCPRGHDKLAVGKTSWNLCKLCNSDRMRAWRKQNPFYVKRGIQNCGFRQAGIKNADGTPFTNVDYDRAYQVQQGRCKGCDRHQSELSRRLDADHDHKTGLFRFLLCANCNRVLGYGKDSPERLRHLADLLEGWEHVMNRPGKGER